MARKIVYVTTRRCRIGDIANDGLFAFCDDGSFWMLGDPTVARPWTRVPDVPQEEDDRPADTEG